MAYTRDRAHFEAWLDAVDAPYAHGPLIDGCALKVCESIVVAAYLAGEAQAGRRASTITRRAAAIAYAHRLADLPSTPARRCARGSGPAA